jgi:hypothetical protein
MDDFRELCPEGLKGWAEKYDFFFKDRERYLKDFLLKVFIFPHVHVEDKSRYLKHYNTCFKVHIYV